MIRALCLCLCLLAAPAGAACRLALALGLDVSGSVDDREYQLQLDGVAAALTATDVRARLNAVPGAPVALAVYEWSSAAYQRVLIDWTPLSSDIAIEDVATRLRQIARVPAPQSTGIGAALQFGASLIARGPVCWQAKIDLSGDGKNNDWPDPRQIKASDALGQITVNGLVIGLGPGNSLSTRVPQIGELQAYFAAEIIHGPEAFTETAQGFDDYADAMRRKLLRELDVPVFGELMEQR